MPDCTQHTSRRALRRPTNPAARRPALAEVQLAHLQAARFDILPAARRILLVVGFIGVAAIIVQSLATPEGALPIDKILHFSGYFLMALVAVLALRPRHCVLASVLLIALSVLLEYLQPLTGRSFEWADVWASGLGVVTGALIGMLARACLAGTRKKAALHKARRNTRRYPAGALIGREGQLIEGFWVIKRGLVLMTKHDPESGQEVPVAELEPGNIVGMASAVDGSPLCASYTALEDTSLYHLSLGEVLQSTGEHAEPACLVLHALANALNLSLQRMFELQQAAPLAGAKHTSAERAPIKHTRTLAA